MSKAQKWIMATFVIAVACMLVIAFGVAVTYGSAPGMKTLTYENPEVKGEVWITITVPEGMPDFMNEELFTFKLIHCETSPVHVHWVGHRHNGSELTVASIAILDHESKRWRIVGAVMMTVGSDEYTYFEDPSYVVTGKFSDTLQPAPERKFASWMELIEKYNSKANL